MAIKNYISYVKTYFIAIDNLTNLFFKNEYWMYINFDNINYYSSLLAI